MASPQPKKFKFADENIEEYERQFKHEHDSAMGYVTRLSPPVQNIAQLAMDVFRPPPSVQLIMESFQTRIRRNQSARFDCFQEPTWD